MADTQETLLARLVENQSNITIVLSEIKKDVKEFVKFQIKTEERLKNGIDKFAEQNILFGNITTQIIGNSKKLIEHKIEQIKQSGRIDAVELRIPSKKVVYSLISIGFFVMGLLIKL